MSLPPLPEPRFDSGFVYLKGAPLVYPIAAMHEYAQAYAKLAVREALERAAQEAKFYELHDGRTLKAVPQKSVRAMLKEYE